MDLIEGINMLCNSLGIFGRIKKRQQLKNNLGTENIAAIYEYSIASRWANKFKKQIQTKFFEAEVFENLDDNSVLEIMKSEIVKFPPVAHTISYENQNFAVSNQQKKLVKLFHPGKFTMVCPG